MKHILLDCIENYIESRKTYLKESTYARYKNLYLNHISLDLKEIKMSKLNNCFIQKYCDSKISLGISKNVVQEILLLIKLTTKWHTRLNSLTPIIFDVELPISNTKKRIQILSEKDQKNVLSFIEQTDMHKYSGIVLSLMTGMRIGEICALKWNDIDLRRRTINVCKTLQRICHKGKKSFIFIDTPKTNSSLRKIPINNYLFEYLMTINPQNKFLYFLTNCSQSTEPRNYRKIFNTLLSKTLSYRISFHSLRHTFATRLIENKVDIKTISELLGHSSVSTTISIYAHSEFNTKRKAVKTLDKLALK